MELDGHDFVGVADEGDVAAVLRYGGSDEFVQDFYDALLDLAQVGGEGVHRDGLNSRFFVFSGRNGAGEDGLAGGDPVGEELADFLGDVVPFDDVKFVEGDEVAGNEDFFDEGEVKQLHGQRAGLRFFDVAEFNVVLVDEHFVGDELHDRGVGGRFGVDADGDSLDFHTPKLRIRCVFEPCLFWCFSANV